MFGFDDLPNELYLILFSYLKKDQLIESFYQLNQRIDRILLNYFSKIFLTTKLTRKQLQQYQQIDSLINYLVIDNYQIGKEFLCKDIPLKNLSEIKLIDSAIDFSEKLQPEIINIVCTNFNENNQKIHFQSKQIQFEFISSEYAKKYDDLKTKST